MQHILLENVILINCNLLLRIQKQFRKSVNHKELIYMYNMMNNIFLLVVDVHSKRLEVLVVSNITIEHMILFLPFLPIEVSYTFGIKKSSQIFNFRNLKRNTLVQSIC